MLVTKENINELQIGQKLYICYPFKPQDNVIYMGIHDERYYLADTYKCISIFKGNPNHCYELRNKQIYTTYDECCNRMRELCIDLINHYNSHQLKKYPILITESQLNNNQTNEDWFEATG